jgi:HD superfamily phosphohydrolase
MERTVRLSLYGDIDHDSPEFDLVWDLFQSGPLTRLRDISLSSTPSRFAAHGMAASRFEHSVGVAYLARKLADWRPTIRDDRDLLMAAALCHDIGSPPFSHISELFMYQLSGRTHEQETEMLLAPGTELDELLRSYRVDPQRVVEIINGQDEILGPLIAGSIDLDNIDNSIHLLGSMGYEADRYDPLTLVKAFRFHQGSAHLDTQYLSQIVGWAETRRELYDILHAEPHLSSATMLYRAIEFAFAAGLIDEQFFTMGESDALFFLANRCGSETASLIDRTLRWKQFHLVYEIVNQDHDHRLLSLYEDWAARKAFTDELAERLGLANQDFAVYIGNDRGEKAIALPFYGRNAEEVSSLFANRRGKQRLSLFAAPDHLRLKGTKKIAQETERAIANLPEVAETSVHAFF